MLGSVVRKGKSRKAMVVLVQSASKAARSDASSCMVRKSIHTHDDSDETESPAQRVT